MTKSKIRNLIFLILMPIACFLLVGIFSFSNVLENAFALSGNGGIIYVSNNSTFNMTTGSLSGGSATNGGGVYIASGGTFNISGGTISGNSATANGNDIYNAGTFTMTGGTVGREGSSSSGYSIYNTGTMNLFGGTTYENIYSSTTINTKFEANITFPIYLGDSATIAVQDYDGLTPGYIVYVSDSREPGTVVTFVGSDIEPELPAVSVWGFDENTFELKTQKDANGNWTISLVKSSYDFPSNWKTQVSSSTYMTTTVTPANLTSIKFVASVPSGYTKIGTLSTELPVYANSGLTDIAFVAKKIFAPVDSSKLFYNLKNLTSIDFSVFNTSKVTSMTSMFSGCLSLTSLNVSNFDTSKVTSMYYMFSGCSGLTSLDLSNFNTSNVTSMNDMFGSCSSLTSLDVGNFDTSKVTNMGYMFYNCSALTSLDVSGFNTSNVTDMNWMFNRCSKLTTLNLSNFNTSNVSGMSSMFYNCSKLASLDLSNFNTLNVTSMYYMFFECSGLTSLDLSNFDTSKVTDMQYMFSGCKGLTSLNISNFDTSKITNMSGMFNGCKSLTSLDLSTFDTSKVEKMQSLFYNCSGLTSLNISNFDTSNITNMSGIFSGCSSLTSLNVGNFNTSKVTDMSYMFYGCSELTSLDLSKFNMTKVTNLTSMLDFRTTNKIQLIKTPYNNTSAISITTGSTLYNEETGEVVKTVPAGTTKSLTYVNENPIKTLPTTWKTEISLGTDCEMTTLVDASTIESISFMFEVPTGYLYIGKLSTGLKVYQSSSNSKAIAFVSNRTILAPENSSSLFLNLPELDAIYFNNFNTTNVTNMASMFSACLMLTKINVSSFDTSNVTNMASMFSNCAYLRSLDLSSFDTSKVTNMSYMFSDSSSLINLDLSNFNTSSVKNMSGMFYYCTDLKTLDLSSFNMTNVTTCSDMFNFESGNTIGNIKTPYNNKVALAFTTDSTLYDITTNAQVTGVSASTGTSKTFARKVTFTIDVYGGNSLSTTSYSGWYGEVYSGTLPTASRTGYNFKGWYSEVSGGTSASSYKLVDDTIFYAHWAEITSGGGSGGSGSSISSDLYEGSPYEDKHDIPCLGAYTFDESLISEILDVFSSFESNTFGASDVTAFSIIDESGDPYYKIIENYGNIADCTLARVQTDYYGSEWHLAIISAYGFGFDQYYYFDGEFFDKIVLAFPNLEYLDVRGLDTTLNIRTFSLRNIPDGKSFTVMMPNDFQSGFVGAPAIVQFLPHKVSDPGPGGTYLMDNEFFEVFAKSFPNIEQMTYLAFVSRKSPEGYSQYEILEDCGTIGITDVHVYKIDPTRADVLGLPIDTENAYAIWSDNFYFQISNFRENIFREYFADVATSLDGIDLRGLSPIEFMTTPLTMDFVNFVILPANNYFEISGCTAYNYKGEAVESFVSSVLTEDSGLEIVRGNLSTFAIKAKDVDLYIEDKKWFDPKKNKIQIKVETDDAE